MARFDAYALRNGRIALDCQADLLDWLETRLVVPLVPAAEAPPAVQRLNPTFDLPDGRFRMMTQFAATIEVRDVLRTVASLAGSEMEIMNALDMLLTGC